VNLVRGLTEAQLRRSPHPALNPIAWTLWHIARCEDVAVNRLLADQAQVLAEGGWASRLGVAREDCGTGMPKDQVADLCGAISLAGLDAYRRAVTARTLAVVGSLPLTELNERLTQARLRKVFVEEGAGGAAADKVVAAYEGHSKGWLLGHLVLTHSYYHVGQAFGVRAMLGQPNPW